MLRVVDRVECRRDVFVFHVGAYLSGERRAHPFMTAARVVDPFRFTVVGVELDAAAHAVGDGGTVLVRVIDDDRPVLAVLDERDGLLLVSTPRGSGQRDPMHGLTGGDTKRVTPAAVVTCVVYLVQDRHRRDAGGPACKVRAGAHRQLLVSDDEPLVSVLLVVRSLADGNQVETEPRG